MPTANRRRADPLDPDASLDGYSSEQLEESLFGPDPEARRDARKAERDGRCAGAQARRPRAAAPQTKFCHACAATLDARAEICPGCGVRQPAVRRRASSDLSRTVAAVLALVSLVAGGIGLHKFYTGRVAAGVLCVLFFWTGIPWIVSLVNLFSFVRMSDERFSELYG